MENPFRMHIAVRGYELDTQGHVNQAVYLQYGEHARWECLRAAGLSQEQLSAAGVGPVTLELNLKFQRELRGGDEVDVTCEFRWGEGKTFQLVQDYLRADGTRVAALTGVGGLLDLSTRRLVPDPRERFRKLATDPWPMSL